MGKRAGYDTIVYLERPGRVRSFCKKVSRKRGVYRALSRESKENKKRVEGERKIPRAEGGDMERQTGFPPRYHKGRGVKGKSAGPEASMSHFGARAGPLCERR